MVVIVRGDQSLEHGQEGKRVPACTRHALHVATVASHRIGAR